MEGIVIDSDEKKTMQKEFYNNDNKNIFKIKHININEILICKGLSPGLNLSKYIIG